MVPLLVVRVCTLVLGGLVPAFASFQALERDDAASQRVLLAYWCSFALLTAAEPLTDAALSWLPLYAETKLALLLWLLTPQFAGAVMVYRGLLSGWLRRHQRAIENTLQSAHLQHGIAALAALLRGSLGLLFTLLRAFWLAGMPARAAAPQPPTTSLQPLWSAEAESAAAEPVPRPISGRPTPLDTAQVALLSANLEESCAMLLRTALAAQAGNQLLASLQSQSAMLGQQTLGQRKRHSRRRTIVSAGLTSTTNSSSYSTYTGGSGGGGTNGQRDTSSRSQSPPESSDASVFGTPPTSRPTDRP